MALCEVFIEKWLQLVSCNRGRKSCEMLFSFLVLRLFLSQSTPRAKTACSLFFHRYHSFHQWQLLISSTQILTTMTGPVVASHFNWVILIQWWLHYFAWKVSALNTETILTQFSVQYPNQETFWFNFSNVVFVHMFVKKIVTCNLKAHITWR